MSPYWKHLLTAFAVTLFWMGAATTSQADPLVLTITNPVQSVSQGGSITFSGTVANPNAQSFTITQIAIGPAFPAFLGVNIPSGFFVNPVPGLTTESGNVLGITASSGATPGTYLFTIALTGNVPNGSGETSNAFPVTITVLSPTAVPEPATMVLLGTGLAGVAARVRRNKAEESEET